MQRQVKICLFVNKLNKMSPSVGASLSAPYQTASHRLKRRVEKLNPVVEIIIAVIGNIHMAGAHIFVIRV